MSRNRKLLCWLLKKSSIFISCMFPVWAICERYPIWTTKHGVSHSIGVGGILILIVVTIIFKRTIFDFLRDRLNLKHAPPLLVWLVLIVISYVLMYVSKFLYDMTSIFWMGFIGCSIGTLLTFIAENCIRKDNNENG
jgi:hypothetical protein